MSTAAFSIPSDSHRQISVRRRSQSPSTPTSAAADEAIRQLVERRRRRHQYGEEHDPKPSLIDDALGAVTAPVRQSVERLGMGRWAFTAIVLGAVGVVLAIGVYTLSGGQSCVVHPATGIARAGRTPLIGAQIRFHPRGMTLPDDATPSATVQDDGTFTITTFTKGDGAPAGDYVATVQWFRVAKDGSVGGNALPPRYGSPTTSPLTVTIREGTNELPPFTFHR
jgi:hypothetical protein